MPIVENLNTCWSFVFKFVYIYDHDFISQEPVIIASIFYSLFCVVWTVSFHPAQKDLLNAYKILKKKTNKTYTVLK